MDETRRIVDSLPEDAQGWDELRLKAFVDQICESATQPAFSKLDRDRLVARLYGLGGAVRARESLRQ
ncbi:MAG: hypothetical protein HYR64_09095 [Fimbriimonas ginsengisoli]|uniref:Uncharacterized protein n=1 Tax=Fimbriimonas ginsengisoli TaxID=1005039 RepID=A0A931LTV2_FIMGI|nr:hypothetical protein [Fimbriimonas ginsengisoli]